MKVWNHLYINIHGLSLLIVAFVSLLIFKRLMIFFFLYFHNFFLQVKSIKSSVVTLILKQLAWCVWFITVQDCPFLQSLETHIRTKTRVMKTCSIYIPMKLPKKTKFIKIWKGAYLEIYDELKAFLPTLMSLKSIHELFF